MQQIHADIQQLGGEIVAVSFTAPNKIAYFLSKYPLPFPVVSDEARAGYRTFALGATKPSTLMGLGIIAKYLRLIFRGWFPTLPDKDEDLWQLGGDFILDREGKLRYAYWSKDPVDRPTNQELVDAFAGAARTG